MRYEGRESIELDEDVEAVHQRVDVWLDTEIGSQYEVEKRASELTLKRTWIDDCWKVMLTTGAAFASLDVLFAFSTGSLQLIVNQAAVLGVGLLLLACAVFFIFESRVIINVRVQDSVVDLELQATDKEQAEADFDSLIMAIKEDKPGTTEPKG
ncbi:hypothetical protein EU546_04470 [Candidatus Thorarchaeota archaeon]|nr:MAG: hypothetical protein EU546_04470 [Candidatus Thorarchaeota archaeon]